MTSEGTGLVSVGTAGWALGKQVRERFLAGSSQLQRYATRLNCCEINSTFYRLHRPSTYVRWLEAVPADFRFVLKAPRQMTHEQKLRDCRSHLQAFLENTAVMGAQPRTVLLFQLPPSLAFVDQVATDFFTNLRELYAGLVACEPRHPSWFSESLDDLWQHFRISRVAADPARVPEAARPGGWTDLSYFRWHGSPRMYFSRYDHERLAELNGLVRTCPAEVVCIFDNTAAGEATGNALELLGLLSASR